jgi:hypothetical protein
VTGPRVREPTRYARLLGHIFEQRYKAGDTVVTFAREDIITAAAELGIDVPRNLGDVIYSFRSRVDLPSSIAGKAPAGTVWIIRNAGRSRYAFTAVSPESALITPSEILAEVKIPDATPGVITMYAQGDEQALLAKLRYNRLIDLFTGVTCYSLQNHLRTTVAGVQLESDEVYVGIDKRGVHFVFPVQAKGGNDRLTVVQIEQDAAMCADKFPNAVCRPVAAQFMADDVIALFEFETLGFRVAAERHYRLTAPDDITDTDLSSYATRPE